MLRINGVTKTFGKQTVLDNLSLVVKERSIFGLVGVNGSGKTTLLRLISGIYQADNGNINFDEKNTYYDVDVKKDIFYVSDDPYFPFASTINSLKTWYEAYYKFDEQAYKDALEMFHLDENKPINSFSKGMKRQTMLVMALSIKPKLLLLDEAFDGLDPIVRFNLKQTLIDFMEDYDSSIIISSHNLKELEDICDSYGILEDGKISTYGDLLESKNNINKYQLAFSKKIDEAIFDEFDVVFKEKQGSVYNLVIKGNKEEIMKELKKLNPVILDSLQVNFEELFIYEHKGGNRNA